MTRLIDDKKFLAALRNSTQNPRAGEALIEQFEAGEFDVAPIGEAAAPAAEETATAPTDKVEER